MADILNRTGTLTTGNNLGFKVGTEENLLKLTEAVPGTFYLTGDTHRLYIGNDDKSLSPINEGVITVANINGLPSLDKDNTNDVNNKYQGQFYYIADKNILAVASGNNWVQINANTDTAISSFGADATTTNGVATVTTSIGTTTTGQSGTPSTGSAQASIAYEGANGVTVSATAKTETTPARITITGDTYSISDEAIGTTGVKIKVSSDNVEENSSEIQFNAGTNVAFANENGVTTISAVDTKVSGLTITPKDGEGATGYIATLSQNGVDTDVTAEFAPQIKVGKTAQTTVDFVAGVAELDVYTSEQIDEKMKALNAVRYLGTIGGTTPSSGYETIAAANAANREIGDAFILAADDGEVGKGSLIIFRGTEGTDGFITAETKAYDVVEDSNEADTTYTLSVSAADKKVTLKNSANTNDVSNFIAMENGTLTTVTATASGTTGITYKVDHNAVETKVNNVVVAANTEKSFETEENQAKTSVKQSAGAELTIPVVVGVTADGNGHITEIKTKDYTVVDSSSSLKENGFTATSVATEGAVTITNSITMVGADGQDQAAQTAAFTVSSSSLQVANAASSAGVVMDIVWGSF